MQGITAFLLSTGLALASAQAATGPDGSPCRAVLGDGIGLESVDGLALVTVVADGAALKLIVDTGAERTVLTSRAAGKPWKDAAN